MVQYDFGNMLTTGELAKAIRVDQRTVRVWAKSETIPSYVNPANRYRYFILKEVINALGLNKIQTEAIDVANQVE